MLLQFLTYAQRLDFKTDFLGDTPYRMVHFRIDHFLKYQNPMVKSTNYYQFDKIKTFLRERQKNSLIEFFSDQYYRGLVTIPLSYVYQNEQNTWVAEVWIAEELFYYAHPFLFPDY